MRFNTSTKHLICLAGLLINLVCASNNALAEDGEWYLRIHSGLSQLSNMSAQTQNIGSIDGEADVILDSGFLAGMAVGYRYGPNWSAELAWEYRSNSSEVTLADSTTFNDGNYASNIFFINGRYHFTTDKNWEPYVGVGLGWIQEIDIDLENSNNEISYSDDGNISGQLFVGMNYLLNKAWAMNAEFRYADFGDIDLEGESTLGNISSLGYNPTTLQFGISYRF